jgi:phosphoglycolate phosphatase-like HAD superfamily hydrolase
MEIKQKECFCPNFIKHFNLQEVSKYARETWEFVNLYSQSRGCNRFQAVLKTIELLNDRPEIKARHASIPDLTPLVEWVKAETKLGNPALEKYAATANIAVINQVLQWSKAVNVDIESMVFGISPFPYVKESLQKMSTKADLMVVSQTPYDALKREWDENNISSYVPIIAGQELGTKSEHLKYAAKNKYADDKILMIGDAPGDLKAARDNGVLFYPINPGEEDKSWERFYNEALDKFFNGSYQGKYENELIQKFQDVLPAVPKWKV